MQFLEGTLILDKLRLDMTCQYTKDKEGATWQCPCRKNVLGGEVVNGVEKVVTTKPSLAVFLLFLVYMESVRRWGMAKFPSFSQLPPSRDSGSSSCPLQGLRKYLHELV